MSKTLNEVISGIEDSKASISNSLTNLGVSNMDGASLSDMAQVISNLGMIVTSISQGDTYSENGIPVTPVTFTLYSGETKTIKIKAGVTPYVKSISQSEWKVNSEGGYYYQVLASEHSMGSYPTVHTFTEGEETYDSPYIDSSGNITLYSGINTAMTVVVKA